MADAQTADTSADLAQFRTEVRTWLADNFPKSLIGKAGDLLSESRVELTGDALAWREALAARGFGAPTWPTEYSGAGLSQRQAKVLQEEMDEVGAFNPIGWLTGMGITMVGPTVLEYGTPEQKTKHLPPIARGEVRWCLGLSEPNAGSDLASLTTKAVVDGDHYVINGQKIWTSGADISQWCGALVRTNSDGTKHNGISFLMLSMDQPGVTTRPIRLIAGASPFCETFFNDAIAEKSDLLGKENDGWSVIKRLLQHERQSQTGTRSTPNAATPSLQSVAKHYVGEDSEGRLDDTDLRSRLASHLMDAKAHALTIARIADEARGDMKVNTTASILKNSATFVAQQRSELTLEIMGNQGLGWSGDEFNDEELATVRSWLGGKAMSIYGGSFEVQKNIISKNILGLPETTQRG